MYSKHTYSKFKGGGGRGIMTLKIKKNKKKNFLAVQIYEYRK